MSANPMGLWETCPTHNVQFRDADGCPRCNRSTSPSRDRDAGLVATRWAITGLRNGWKMPSAPWWKRLPVVRHVRVAYHAARLVIWEDFWTRAGYVPSGYDDWVLAGMLRGWEERANG